MLTSLSDSWVEMRSGSASSLLELVGTGAELHLDRTLIAAAHHRQADLLARLVLEHGGREVARLVDLLARDGGDLVALAEAGAGRRAAGRDRRDDRAVVVREVVVETPM